jgi:peptidoglycan/LPS O-acetylase OafA/YrhL
MRKYFIDNLRSSAILLLFIHHSFWIYNSENTTYYINGTGNLFLSIVVITQIPWFMPLMFVLAGISTAYALRKRTTSEYIIERIQKLLIPLISGIIIVIPSITYFAERFHNNYNGNYFQQYILFFSKDTDFKGVTGGFTPGHLWFLFYLFLISLLTLPLIYLYNKYNKKININKINFLLLLILFILPYVGRSVIRISEKGLLEEFMFYIIGYFILSNDAILEKCKKYCFLSLGMSIVCMIYIVIEYIYNINIPIFVNDLIKEYYAYCTIIGFIGLYGRYCNFKNKLTHYFSTISFGIYIFHFTWIVGIAFYLQKFISNIFLQLIIIIPLSLIFTIITTELCRRWFITRKLFGLKL